MEEQTTQGGYIDEQQIINERIIMSASDFSHKPIATEKSLYNYVATGNITALTNRKPSLRKKGLGTLSIDPTRNILFHFIINTANCARYCINAGMDTETAYTLSDLYIRKADKVNTIEEIERINYHMMFDYTARMQAFILPKNDYPALIQRAIEYIDANLHRSIQIKDVADHVSTSASNFSHRFTKYTGMKFSDYLIDKRMYLAKEYLRHTDFSITEISNSLAFCTPSYFATKFKSYVGASPQQYRDHKNAI